MPRSNNSLIDPKKFHESITNELVVTKDRVRNLIGDANWLEEGRFKESILRSVLRRFLPKSIDVGTGFILKNENGQAEITKQIDIIIYDNRYPVLFKEGDFIVTTPENVRGIIEVKTKLNINKLREALTIATDNGKLIADKNIFNGLFVYEKDISNSSVYGRNDAISFDNALKLSQGIVNHISLGKDTFIKFWDNNRANPHCDEYSIYRIEGLSFSYFISNLLEQLSDNRMEERWWFLYPIEGGKEGHYMRGIPIL